MPKDELIAALEKADGPSFALEVELHRWRFPDADELSIPNNYTASIDAALTLVDDETDPLDIIAQALATAWDERGGVVFLPLHICITALRATERGEAGR